MVHGCVVVLFLLFLKGKYNILNCPKVKTKSPTPTAQGRRVPWCDGTCTGKRL